MLRKICIASAAFTLLFASNVRAQYILCSSYERTWFDAEYLCWKVSNSPEVIPLVVQGPPVPNGTPVLGQPGTAVVLGGNEIEHDWQSGGRFSLGYLIDDSNSCQGVEALYFFLPEESHRTLIFSNGLPTAPFFSVPFFDVTTQSESSVAIASPGNFLGKAVLQTTNSMQGAELNFFGMFPCKPDLNIVFLGGLRYWNFVDNLNFFTSSPSVATPVTTTDIYQTVDSFGVDNNFIGGQLGIKLEYILKQYIFNLNAKVALGAMFESCDINGYLVTNDFNSSRITQVFPGGYFTQPSNIGNHNHVNFAVIPETEIKIGYQLTDNFRLQLGYTFLWVSHMLWASDQMSRYINPTQSAAIEGIPHPVLVGEGSPSPQLKSKSLWVQGVTIGFNYSF